PPGAGRIICLRAYSGLADYIRSMLPPCRSTVTVPLGRGSSYHDGRMRVGCIPLLMMAALLIQAQEDSLVTKPAGDLSIPAELTKTVRADKAHRGDPVEYTTLEAVIVAPKLMM